MTRILVIEDSQTQAEAIRIVLDSDGFAVEVAGDGQAGLDALQRARFDVVLSDVRLPRASGHEVCRSIKASTPAVPVILMTTLREPADIVDGLACGADMFLPKPIDPTTLAARVRGLLDNQRARQQAGDCKALPLMFMGRKFEVNPQSGQMMDLLMAALEEIVRKNRDLEEAQRALVAAKQELEDRSRRDRLLLGSAIDQISESVFITDTEGMIVYVNPGFERVTGYSREEALGQNPRLLRSGRHSDEFYTDLWATLRRGEHWKGHLVNRRKDGKLFDAATVVSPVRDETGRMTHFVSVQQDMTHERELEAMLSQSQKMEALGQLTGGIAHDFNNLLTVMLGHCELALEDLAPSHPMRDSFEPILAAGKRAASLTQRLLTFSRKQIVTPVDLDLDAVMTGMQSVLRRIIGEDVALQIHGDGAPARVRIDAVQMEQIILNLAVNARDAMPRGGSLRLETAAVTLADGDSVLARTLPPGPYVRLTVADSGIGMDKDTLTHIFEPFFTTKPKGKGTGLGLATVYGIVQQNRGAVHVHSEPGKGATFSIYLPAVTGAREGDLPRAKVDQMPRGSETILLVEDEAEVRALARSVLERNGYTVIEASNAGEALLAFEESSPTIHLVLTDVVMPRVSGPELAARLSARRPGLAVLFMSGHLDRAGDALDEATLARRCLAKPFTPHALARKVRDVLDDTSG